MTNKIFIFEKKLPMKAAFKLLFIIAFLFFISCSSNHKSKITISDSTADTVLTIPNTDYSTQNKIYLKYKIPLPIEIINFLKRNKKFDENLLNPIDKAQTYTTSISKTLNLGIYTADLTYCTVLGANQLSMDYYKLCYEISKELNINDGYTEQYYKRAIENIDNIDSLIILANESYDKACNYLESQGRKNILPFFIIGGWYESLSLVIRSEKIANIPHEEIKKFILSQEPGIENLINYLYDVQIETSAFEYNKELKVFIDHLKKLRNLYQNFRSTKDENIYKIITDEILTYRKLIVQNQFY